ncbi:hypothetical protein WA026_023558 [Henosepilachna vigintioctopunctata]|uniref:Uncharacterized protein n=1 Tax=Henosepilachna vigintioctopunctata TaxID=420089 RepID=A0AAW1UPX8_9CUCU
MTDNTSESKVTFSGVGGGAGLQREHSDRGTALVGQAREEKTATDKYTTGMDKDKRRESMETRNEMGDATKTLQTPGRDSLKVNRWPGTRLIAQRSQSVGAPEDKKRKMDDRSPSQHCDVMKKKLDPDAFVLCEAIEMMTKLVKDLEKNIEKNTKLEIKDIALRMKRQMLALNKEQTTNWLDRNKYEKVETPTYDVDIQVDIKRQSREIGTQTTPWIRNAHNEALNTLVGVTSLEDFLNIENKEWDDKIYTNTEVILGNPLNTEEGTVKVVFVNKNELSMTRSIQKLFKERFPMLGNPEEEMEILEQTTRNRRQTSEIKQKIIKMIYKEDDRNIWEMLEKLRNETVDDEKIAIHYINEMSIERFRKMVEIVFLCSTTKVLLYTNKEMIKAKPGVDKKKGNPTR